MKLGSHIKARRAELGISQDELAGRIYVSRQTISSWENGKTYPDVQSLLLLSQVFGTTIDELVRGDVDTMKETIEKDVQLLRRLGGVMLGFIALMVLALVWWVCQMTVWDLSILQTLPTLALVIVLWGIALFAASWADRIKKEHDLVTYQEVLAFWNGEPVDRDTERGRRERLIPRWMKVVRVAGLALIGAAAGYLMGELFRTRPVYERLLDEMLAESAEEYKVRAFAARFCVKAGSVAAGRALRDVLFPQDARVTRVERGEEHFIPDGNTVLLPGDILTVEGEERAGGETAEALAETVGEETD